jgi:hypothetical protein
LPLGSQGSGSPLVDLVTGRRLQTSLSRTLAIIHHLARPSLTDSFLRLLSTPPKFLSWSALPDLSALESSLISPSPLESYLSYLSEAPPYVLALHCWAPVQLCLKLLALTMRAHTNSYGEVARLVGEFEISSS